MKTPEQVKAEFEAAGVTMKDWCEAHGIDRYVVTDLMRGVRKGIRGKSHEVAIMLGLKDGAVIAPKDFMPSKSGKASQS